MFSNITFYIPSCGRANVTQMTLQAFLEADVPVSLVVPSSERRAYENHRVPVIPCRRKGIAATRQFILEQCPTPYVAMFDDDMYFYRRPSFKSTKLVRCGLRPVLRECERLLEKGFEAVGVSARQNNWSVTKAVISPARIFNVHFYLCDALLENKIRFDAVPVMEDMHVNLSLLEKGFENAVTYKYAWNQRGSNAAGGCSTYRTAEVQDKAARRLKELHPHCITVVKKKAQWAGMEERTDVRIAWRKAYGA